MEKRYFGYIRVSTAKQGEKGVSLIEQKDAIDRYAQRFGLPVAQWFEERESAAKRGRLRRTRTAGRSSVMSMIPLESAAIPLHWKTISPKCTGTCRLWSSFDPRAGNLGH